MLRSIAVLLFVSGAVLACSEDEPSARKSLGGVEGQTPLSELDDDQLEAVCDAANDKLEATFDDEALARGACLLGAHVSANAAAMADDEVDEKEVCEQTFEACIDLPVESERACGSVLQVCTATVNDFDTCLSNADAVYRELSELDCDDVSDEDTDELDQRIQASANACDVLVGCFGDNVPQGDGGERDSGEDEDAGDGDGDGDGDEDAGR
jgi:hypothetical protein